MPFDVLAQPGLATAAYTRLADAFALYGHHPSDAQWAAIRDLLDHLERAANGDLTPALYLSAIPAGTGKSTAIAAFAATLMDNPAYADVGVLIMVNRVTEAQDMAKALSPYGNRLCVYTADDDVRALGDHAEADGAQVCVSTQAALKATIKALDGAPFHTASRFHYRGARRAVICWDESFAFNRPVTLDGDATTGLVKVLRRQSDSAANALLRWTLTLAEGSDGLHDVPNFAAMGVDLRRLEDDAGEDDNLVAQARALAIMSGGQGYATRGDFNTPTLITHYPEIPADLMPLIVTDASARVNASYAQMAGKVPLVWLQDAPKTYRNMSIRIVPAAASRSVYRNRKTTQGKELIDMAVRYVRSVAPEEVLIVSYKGWMTIRGVTQTTIRQAIDAQLTDCEQWIDKTKPQRRVHHLTWGRHTATNDYKHVRHVLLMGLNFLPRPAGYAAAGAALDLDLLMEHPTNGQIEAMRRGMLMDSTLQAILRGNARLGLNGDCGHCEVVIPQTKQTGLREADYRVMFPEAGIERDNVLMPPRPLRGHRKHLSEIVARRLQAGETELSNPSLCAEMSISKQQLSALVKHPDWQAYVVALGLQPTRLPGRTAGLRLIH
jgi:hypothetical protein